VDFTANEEVFMERSNKWRWKI